MDSFIRSDFYCEIIPTTATPGVSRLTFAVGRASSVDGRRQQRRAQEDVHRLVPVGGAGEQDDRLPQQILLWGDGAVRLRSSSGCEIKSMTEEKITCWFIVQVVHFKYQFLLYKRRNNEMIKTLL